MIDITPDHLRLLAIPFFGLAAVTDYRTRRVHRSIWYVPVAIGLFALVWEATIVMAFGSLARTRFAIQVMISILAVGSLGIIAWQRGAVGLADAKALLTVAILLPTEPTFVIHGQPLPLFQSTTGVFSLTIVTNAVMIGLAYPLALLGRNLAHGRIHPAMFVGVPVHSSLLSEQHGRLLETTNGFTHRGIDLDALECYLTWNDQSLATLREQKPSGTDRWNAAAFVTATDGIYGTEAADLRAALDLLVTRDQVWISPGIPFLVPVTLAIFVSYLLGDLVGALGWIQ